MDQKTISQQPKYRVGRSQGRAILETATGHEYLIFPVGKNEHVNFFCDYLNACAEKTELLKIGNFSFSEIKIILSQIAMKIDSTIQEAIQNEKELKENQMNKEFFDVIELICAIAEDNSIFKRI